MCEVTKCESCNVEQSVNNDEHSNTYGEQVLGEQVLGEGVKFERIRRITGYLVGDISRWNNGKTAELNDRVNHEQLSSSNTQ